MSWICPHCGNSHDTTSCPVRVRPYTRASEDPELDRLLGTGACAHSCTPVEAPQPPKSREPTDVHEVFYAWERDPNRTLPGLIDLLVQLAEHEHGLPAELVVGEQYAAAFIEAVAGDSPAPPGVRALFEEPS